MLNFVLLTVLVGVPLVGLCWWRKSTIGILSLVALWTVSVHHWMTRNVVWELPYRNLYNLIQLLPVDPFYPLYCINFLCWWLGCFVLAKYLRQWFTESFVIIGVLLSIVNFAVLWNGFGYTDGLSWLLVVGIYYFLTKKFNIWGIRFGLPACVALLVWNISPPLPSRPLAPVDFLQAVIMVGWMLPFVIDTIYSERMNFSILPQRLLLLIPVYIVVCIIATDWYRWALFAYPLLLPFVLASRWWYSR